MKLKTSPSAQSTSVARGTSTRISLRGGIDVNPEDWSELYKPFLPYWSEVKKAYDGMGELSEPNGLFELLRNKGITSAPGGWSFGSI